MYLPSEFIKGGLFDVMDDHLKSYMSMGFGSYLAYFSKMFGSECFLGDCTFGFLISSGMNYKEKVIRQYMNLVLTNLGKESNLQKFENISIFELVKLLHENPNEHGAEFYKFASAFQFEHNCWKENLFDITFKVENYIDAWNNFTKGLFATVFQNHLKEDFMNSLISKF